ncbi:MAG: sugar transferase, partial [Muribaculaceae bacterium]|nr:sugar transferase [Muribaculaceae bacterium]
MLTPKRRLSDVAGEPLCDITGPSVGQSTLNLKRAGDVFVSALALLALLPVFAIVAITIKIDSSGPVFYRQERVGYRKRPFRILKFRTMRADAE